MNILILTRFGDLAASSRLRAFQYMPFFEAAGIDVDVLPLFSNQDLLKRYMSGSYKATRIVNQYFRRVLNLMRKTDKILWIEKELLPWAPAWFELILLRHQNYVMDFDDAIFHQYDQHRAPMIRKMFGKKIDRLMKNSMLVMAGNAYLAKRAREAGCNRVEIVPTVIDLNRYAIHKVEHVGLHDEIVIGWIGSPSTTKYLKILERPLTELSREIRIRFRVIGGMPVKFPNVDIECLQWKESDEARHLSECHIGVMPLPDSPWEKGKCGYKLIQYMACSLPVVGSPVGVNSKIITPNNGFLCQTENEWLVSLRRLALDADLREKMGCFGRQSVEAKYSLQVTGPQVIAYLESLAI